MIAGVLKRQMDEAKSVGADQVIATDDDTAITNLPPLDAVADGRRKNRREADRQGQGREECLFGPRMLRNAAKYPSVKAVFGVLER